MVNSCDVLSKITLHAEEAGPIGLIICLGHNSLRGQNISFSKLNLNARPQSFKSAFMIFRVIPYFEVENWKNRVKIGRAKISKALSTNLELQVLGLVT